MLWNSIVALIALALPQDAAAERALSVRQNGMSDLENHTGPYARTGNWTHITCDEFWARWSASKLWQDMDASDAWADAVHIWKTYDRDDDWIFSSSVSATINGPEGADCGRLGEKACELGPLCYTFLSPGLSGPAGAMIWESFVVLHTAIDRYHALLQQAASVINADDGLSNSSPIASSWYFTSNNFGHDMPEFEEKFSLRSTRPDDSWRPHLQNMISMGSAAVAGAWLNGSVVDRHNPNSTVTLQDLENSALTVYKMGALVAQEFASNNTGNRFNSWKPQALQHRKNFTTYIGQAVNAWAEIADQQLKDVFNGSDSSISILGSLMADGKLMARDEHLFAGSSSVVETLRNAVAPVFFAMAIPTLWSITGTYPVVIDSGYHCGQDASLEAQLNKTSPNRAACYDGKLYYLSSPQGRGESCYGAFGVFCVEEPLSVPPGIEWLDGDHFGGIRVVDLIAGSVRTYAQNGNRNGSPPLDPLNNSTARGLMNLDVTTPGFIRIPVCTSEVAHAAWAQRRPDTNNPNYPCVDTNLE